MAEEIILPAGVLPLATEGDLAGDGPYDVRIPHCPVDLGLFQKVGEGQGTYDQVTSSKIKDADKVFVKRAGDYVLVEQISKSKINSQSVGASQTLGAYWKSSSDRINSSGVTIGPGVDLGASYSEASDIIELFNVYEPVGKFPDPQMLAIRDALLPAAAKRGVRAIKLALELKNAAVFPMSPQQALNLSFAMWKRKESNFDAKLKTYPKVKGLHPALVEVITRGYYSNNSRGNVFWKLLDNIEKYPTVEGSPDYNKNFIAQCDVMLGALEHKDTKEVYSGRKEPLRACLVAFVQTIKKTLKDNPTATIKVANRPIQTRELLEDEENSLLSRLATESKKAKHISKYKQKYADDPTTLAKKIKRMEGYSYRNNFEKDLKDSDITVDMNSPLPVPNPDAIYTGGKGIDDGTLKRAQQILIDSGYLAATFVSRSTGETVSSADGEMGGMTRQALKDFQEKHNLSETGKLDSATISIIFDKTKVINKDGSRTEVEEIEFTTPELDAAEFGCFH
ncbi:MAG: hypothetical protein GY810_10485 [Aureispira sp.]|nr:hypothetical protein [Aureispira sp.]